jgi:hypothetical protein
MVFHLLCSFLAVLLYLFSSHCTSVDPVIGIVALQKDEVELLSYWLEYHSKIVNLENILILDNYSEVRGTKQILKSWIKKGLHVLFHQGPYNIKGELTSKAFQQILPHVDVIIPLDLDEFIFAFNGDQPVVSKTKILLTLNQFWAQQESSCMGLQQYYSNAIIRTNQTMETIDRLVYDVYQINDAKKIAKARDVVQFDHGNHHVMLKRHNGFWGYPENCTTGYGSLGLLHYHWSNPEHVVRRAIMDAVAFGNLPEGFTLEKAKANKEIVENANNTFHALPGGHKLGEILKYIRSDPNSPIFLTPSHHRVYVLDTLSEIISKIGST